ncbi:ArsC/Spx/MgsR family protein [Coraliomargarita sp. W4R72]
MKGIVSFYGKSGCKGNARQIEQLKQAGYVVQVIDLLTKEWDVETLLKFFGKDPLHACVNERAPQVTSGEFKPEAFDDVTLLQAMIKDPILIKRPLLFYRGEFACGFDHPLVKELLDEEPIDYECQQHDNCTHPPEQIIKSITTD